MLVKLTLCIKEKLKCPHLQISKLFYYKICCIYVYDYVHERETEQSWIAFDTGALVLLVSTCNPLSTTKSTLDPKFTSPTRKAQPNPHKFHTLLFLVPSLSRFLIPPSFSLSLSLDQITTLSFSSHKQKQRSYLFILLFNILYFMQITESSIWNKKLIAQTDSVQNWCSWFKPSQKMAKLYFKKMTNDRDTIDKFISLNNI